MIIHAYSTEFIVSATLAGLALAVATGCFLDLVLGDRGFGFIGNALLVCVGLVAGLQMQGQLTAPLRSDQVASMIVSVAASTTGIILLFGVLKKRLYT